MLGYWRQACAIVGIGCLGAAAWTSGTAWTVTSMALSVAAGVLMLPWMGVWGDARRSAVVISPTERGFRVTLAEWRDRHAACYEQAVDCTELHVGPGTKFGNGARLCSVTLVASGKCYVDVMYGVQSTPVPFSYNRQFILKCRVCGEILTPLRDSTGKMMTALPYADVSIDKYDVTPDGDLVSKRADKPRVMISMALFPTRGTLAVLTNDRIQELIGQVVATLKIRELTASQRDALKDSQRNMEDVIRARTAQLDEYAEARNRINRAIKAVVMKDLLRDDDSEETTEPQSVRPRGPAALRGAPGRRKIVLSNGNDDGEKE